MFDLQNTGQVIQVHDPQLDALRRRFDELRPALLMHLAVRTADIAGPRPAPVELIEITWRAICNRPGSVTTYSAVVRELDCALHNWMLRRRISAGDLDSAFLYLQPHLRAWASNLSQGLPAPRPEPDEFVHDAFLKLRGAPAFCTADNPIGYAFRVVKNLVIDHARRASRAAEIASQQPPRITVELVASPERLEAIAERAKLSAQERCMVFRKVFGGLSVTAAQKACGGPPGAPYYVLEKIYDKLAAAFGVERSRT